MARVTKTNPLTDGRLDLDMISATRREAKGEAPVVVYREREWVLPLELDFDCIELLEELDDTPDAEMLPVMKRLMQTLLGGDQYADFMQLKPRPYLEDMNAIVVYLPALYGATMGESDASAESSEATTDPSRPTSSGTTD
jgi:hypothetical protein